MYAMNKAYNLLIAARAFDVSQGKGACISLLRKARRNRWALYCLPSPEAKEITDALIKAHNALFATSRRLSYKEERLSRKFTVEKWVDIAMDHKQSMRIMVAYCIDYVKRYYKMENLSNPGYHTLPSIIDPRYMYQVRVLATDMMWWKDVASQYNIRDIDFLIMRDSLAMKLKEMKRIGAPRGLFESRAFTKHVQLLSQLFTYFSLAIEEIAKHNDEVD